MLQAHPDISVFFGQADAMALGAAQAVRVANVGHKVTIVGFDGDIAGLKAVRDGTIDATMTQQTQKMGRMAVDSAQTLIDGGKVPAQQLVARLPATKANAKAEVHREPPVIAALEAGPRMTTFTHDGPDRPGRLQALRRTQALDQIDLEVKPGRGRGPARRERRRQVDAVEHHRRHVRARHRQMTWQGRPYAPDRRRATPSTAGIGLIHQEMRLLPDLSVAENVFVGRWPMQGRARRPRAR